VFTSRDSSAECLLGLALTALNTDNKTAYHCYLAGHSLYVHRAATACGVRVRVTSEVIPINVHSLRVCVFRYFNPPVALQKSYIKQLAEDLGANFGLKKVRVGTRNRAPRPSV
jgi:hypothetical protein